MSKPFEIAENTVREFISKEQPFSYEDLCSEITKRGGIGRVAFGVTVSQFIDEFEENDVIYYDASSHVYRFKSEIRAIIKEQMDAVILE